MTTDNKQFALTAAQNAIIASHFPTDPANACRAHAAVMEVLSKLRGAGEPVGEVVLFGGDSDLKEISWRKGKLPPVGTKLYAAPQASAEADDSESAIQWRRLALQFDGHRMQALGHLKTLLAHPQAHAEAVRSFLAAPPLSGEQVLAERIRALKSAPAAEDFAKGAGDVPVYRDNEHFHKEASVAELEAWQRGWDECREFDRQQRSADVSSLHEALRWTAACLLAYTDGSEGESFRMTETGETKLISEVLDMADAALAPPEQIN